MSKAPKRRFAAHDVQRRAPLRAGLGEGERAGAELEDRQRDAPGRLGTAFEPAQTARDHQVQHEKQLAFQRNDDALAQSPHGDDAEAFGRGERRFCGAQHERD